ncbi:MAG: hypothetical protein CME70_10145 [Halobacteriovorax sp.]|nr:hypothetical protein [Halobacteriovorax sp.]|tara:strand:- start:43869 stop:44504 length:636 start_codon:yes stop_codon:yes gene_type:complete
MEEKQISTPLLDGHDYRPIKTCPKCTSVFITDDECEGCGFKLAYNPVGEAFGEKSFYSIKEHYWGGQSRLVQHWPELEKKSSVKAKKYLRDLDHRYEVLLTFLLGESEEDRGFYWLEFQDLCLELVDYGINPESLSIKLNDHSFHGYAPLIHDFLSELKESQSETSTVWNKFMDFRIGGVLKLRFLLISGIVLAAVSTASLLVYQYFFLFS